MAVYNGERYIEKQIFSILNQLNDNDELIILDDCSSDLSVVLINNIADQRIKFVSNKINIGVVKTFERAISIAKGEYIFLSDQDDIWLPGKVKSILNVFDTTESLAVVSNACVIDVNENVILESFFQWRKSGPGFIKNIYKNSFLGCCLAFRSEAVNFIIPFPRFILMHDEWIGLTCTVAGKVYFLNESLILYRRHDKNVSEMKPGTIMYMIKKRFTYIIYLFFRFNKIFAFRRSHTY
jgi:GT2 family glycosyltransferase